MKKTALKIVFLISMTAILPIFTAAAKEYTVSKGKSIIFFEPEFKSKNISWQIDSGPVLSESKGVITAENEGIAVVTAKCGDNVLKTYTINVVKKDGVRAIYFSPVNPKPNDKITLNVITDQSVQDVSVLDNLNNVDFSNKETDKNTYIWHFNAKVPSTQKIKFKVLRNGIWYTDESCEITIPAGSEQRQVSDKCLNFLAEQEGFLTAIRKDPLTTREVYDIGHGETIKSGKAFYNNITQKEAYAHLSRRVSEVYSAKVNDFLVNNAINCNQNQFDALTSFVYNLGTKWMQNSTLKKVILNCKQPQSLIKGRVTYKSGINVRSLPNDKSAIKDKVPHNKELVLLSENKFCNHWYMVRTSENKVGFCFDGGIEICSRDQKFSSGLNDVKVDDFVREFYRYHHAGGKCVKGLMNRRISELGMFFFGDYARDGQLNKYEFSVGCSLSK